MLKIKLFSIGKNKEDWLEEGVNQYIRRLKGVIEVTCHWAKNDIHLMDLVSGEKNLVCLDPAGQELSSTSFSNWLFSTSRRSLVIGGAEGLPAPLKIFPLISLSKLTFTHQMTRLIVLEQMYRASEIFKGTPYHRE